MPVCGGSPVPAPLLLDGDDDAEAPDDSAFLAFLACFLDLGFVSAVVSELPEEASLADGELDVPLLLAPGLSEDPDVLPAVPGMLDDEPELELPVVPEAPEVVSLAPDAPDDEVPLLPDVPEEPGWLLLDGMVLEAPLAPVVLESLAPGPGALCEGTVDDGELVLLSVLAPLWANAMDDTDAAMTSESERRVFFNVMSNSLN